MQIACGDRRYEWQGDWAQMPSDLKLGYTHGIVEDQHGRIYVANQGDHGIVVFDTDGRYVASWGVEYRAGAHGLTISHEDHTECLYLANTGLAEVVKTTLDGTVIWKITTPRRPDIYDDKERKFSPTQAAVGPNGRLYVADGYGQPWVHIYTLDGRYLESFGGPGSEPGKLDCPHGIQIANRANRRIDNFTLAGRFVATAIDGSLVRYPCTTVPHGGDLYIPDLFCRVSIFDRHNRLIGHLGDYVDGVNLTAWEQFKSNEFPDLAGYPNIAVEKRVAGRFISPHGLHVDRHGNIFVVEWIQEGRITRLKRLH